MSDISKAEVALLGLLCEEDSHPYQLEKKVEYRCMREWTELSMSSIYKLLRKLEKEKLVSSKSIITEDNKTRRVYQVTTKGRQVVKERLILLLSEPEHMIWRMDLATYNFNLVPKQDSIKALKQYKDRLNKKIKEYQELALFLKEHQCPDYRIAVAKRPDFLLKAEIKWVDSFLREISK